MQLKRKPKSDQTEKFKRDIQGLNMSHIQKLEYLRMNDIEKEKFIASIKPKIKEDQKEDQKHIHVKIIKPGQVCVMVLNMRGKPLMPTSPRKARFLLKNGKAKVVKRNPFTIQLKYATGENKQPIILALDPGYKNVGFSAITKKRELISGEVVLRTDIPERLIEKKMYRTNRRSRNTRYRKPRFENRHIKEGWLAPSIQHKLDTYIRLVKRFTNILPISQINIETSPFDTQKMQNPEISGIEYQHGTLQGYEVKEYLLEKFGRKCAYRGETDVPLETEHIIPTSRGGTNRISNLTIACHKCNQEKGNMTAAEFGFPNIQLQAKQSLKAAAFMNIVRSRLVDNIKKSFSGLYIENTFGYITKYNRKKLGLEKSHANDAFVIANGQNPIQTAKVVIRSRPYQVTQIRRNNRQLQMNRKGFKPSIRTKRYKYSYGDLVIKQSSIQTSGWGEKLIKKDKIVYSSKGVFNYGKWIRLANPIKGEKDLSLNIEDVRLLKNGSGLLFQLPKIENKKGSINNVVEKKNDFDTFKQMDIIDSWK